MRRLTAVALVLVSTRAFAHGPALLPRDAARLAARIEACVHFAGEFKVIAPRATAR